MNLKHNWRKVFLFIFVFPAVVTAGEAGLQKGTFSNSFGARDYYIYAPDKNSHKPRPMMVALHGCTQTAPEFAAQSGFTALAEKYGFIAVFPEQHNRYNILRCWNWFKPENLARNTGELSIIAEMTRKLSRDLNADAIYISGLSAGAAMAANIYACHSDLYSGLALHSGVEFRAAKSEGEAQQAMKNGSRQNLSESAREAVECSGSQAKTGRVVVIHGSEDSVVNPLNAGRAVTQFTKIHDLLDDGAENESHSLAVLVSESKEVPSGYQYQVDLYGRVDRTPFIMKVTVGGMKHAWSGAYSKGQYADQKGPDAGEIIWHFLSEEK